MEAKAVARTIRITSHKAKLVLDLTRGENAGEAIAILELTNEVSSPVTEKVLMSALANVEYSYDMNTDELVAEEAYINEGPTLKRFRPRVQDRTSAINKHTNHITIAVSDGKEETKEI